jgi:hypothetical protein
MMLRMQTHFRLVVPLKEVLQVEEEGAAVVVERLQLQALVRYRLGLALASHHTFGSAEVVLAPLIHHRRPLVEVVDLGADLAAWASVLAERTVLADHRLGRPFGQLGLQQPNFASHL